MAIASINEILVRKGLLSLEEVSSALSRAEASITGDSGAFQEMSPANRDAVCFPIRMLHLANSRQSADGVPPFSELARTVGRTKQPYSDQM
jgi:hypothetical protein